jgi:hypothetical protein
MLQVYTLRELWVADPAGAALRPLSAASGLVQLGRRLFVIADDENQLGCFDLEDGAPGRLVRLFDGELPQLHDARKAAKPDCEALLRLPAFAGHPDGALLALGSGSRCSRQRAAWMALHADGDVHGPAQVVDLAPLFEPLRAQIADLNIEGAFLLADQFCLLQRGNGAAGVNALIGWHAAEVLGWLGQGGPVPALRSIRRFKLGAIDGVPLSFTDGVALPDGRWLFSAAAEDTRDTCADARCLGSAIGIVSTDGTVELLQRLALKAKVEGVAASVVDGRVELLMVTDGDDRGRAAMLLGASWGS